MFCMKCGNKLEEGSKFCTACGASVKGGDDTRSNETLESSDGKKVPWGIITFGAVMVGVIMLLVNIHTCDWCHKTYVGAQYYDLWDTTELMCKDCALEYYMGPGYKNYKK